MVHDGSILFDSWDAINFQLVFWCNKRKHVLARYLFFFCRPHLRHLAAGMWSGPQVSHQQGTWEWWLSGGYKVGPQTIAKLVNISNNYGLWMFMVLITAVNGVCKSIAGPHCRKWLGSMAMVASVVSNPNLLAMGAKELRIELPQPDGRWDSWSINLLVVLNVAFCIFLSIIAKNRMIKTRKHDATFFAGQSTSNPHVCCWLTLKHVKSQVSTG